MKLHELELPLIYDGLSFTLQRTYKARSAQWAAVVGFSVHISRTQPLTAEGASLLHTLALVFPLRDHSFFLEFRNQFRCLSPYGSPV